MFCMPLEYFFLSVWEEKLLVVEVAGAKILNNGVDCTKCYFIGLSMTLGIQVG